MKVEKVYITGIGSVSSFGPAGGLIRNRESRIRTIESWPTRGLRKAYLVEPFLPSAVVPGLKTRRLDRLSVWALVSSSLALQDARVDLGNEARARCGVVFGTGFGPTELTSVFCGSVADSGCNKADAIVFPETLDNSAASHVAKKFGFQGPNITLSCRGISGEAAILQAASILECGDADLVVVMAGDTLVRANYEWYESAGVLSATCFGEEASVKGSARFGRGLVPGEGLAAFVMESGSRYLERGAKAYGRFVTGCMGSDPTALPFSWGRSTRPVVDLIRRTLGAANPSDVRLVVATGNGSPVLDDMEARSIREVFGPAGGVNVLAPKTHLGEFDGNALLRLTVAFSSLQDAAGSWVPRDCELATHTGNLLLLLGASTGGGRAALGFEVL